MLNIKKYANGQFFDTINKKYIKVAKLKELIQKGEKIKVTLAKTGKDITDSIIEQFSKKEEKKKNEKTKKLLFSILTVLKNGQARLLTNE